MLFKRLLALLAFAIIFWVGVSPATAEDLPDTPRTLTSYGPDFLLVCVAGLTLVAFNYLPPEDEILAIFSSAFFIGYLAPKDKIAVTQITRRAAAEEAVEEAGDSMSQETQETLLVMADETPFDLGLCVLVCLFLLPPALCAAYQAPYPATHITGWVRVEEAGDSMSQETQETLLVMADETPFDLGGCVFVFLYLLLPALCATYQALYPAAHIIGGTRVKAAVGKIGEALLTLADETPFNLDGYVLVFTALMVLYIQSRNLASRNLLVMCIVLAVVLHYCLYFCQ